MAAPPQPSNNHPLEQYMWLTKSGLVDIAEDFKGGAFKDKINWNVDLFDCFNILFKSPLLDQQESGLVAATATRIKEIQAALKRGEKVTYADIMLENAEINWGWEAMIAEDGKSRGVDRVADTLKILGLDATKEGDEFDIEDTPAGKVIRVKKPRKQGGDNSGDAGVSEAAAKTGRTSQAVSEEKGAGTEDAGLMPPSEWKVRPDDNCVTGTTSSNHTKGDRTGLKTANSTSKTSQKNKGSDFGNTFKRNMRSAFM